MTFDATSDAEYYADTHHYLGIASASESASALEARGWKAWLTTIFPFAFPAEFASFHEQFWEIWWMVCMLIRDSKPVPPELLNLLLLWGRALAKSSSGTPSSLMKGAIVGRIYSIYLSETIDQSSSHLANVRYLITHPESKLVHYYPHMELTPTVPTALGLKSKDTENVFITKGGSIFRALGIDSAARGLIIGGKRPDDFNVDDIDDVNHSPHVSNKNLQRLTRSILLTRDISSNLPVTTKLLQNIVIEHGVVNQIHTGKTDAFAERTTIGVVNTFKHLDTESYYDEKGQLRHKILPTSIPSWSAVSIEKAQAVLDLIGIDAFLAECQNEFGHLKAGRVIPEYDRKLQRISWSMFENAFGERRIPAHWQAKAGLDVGYSAGLHPHYSAWVFVATSAENANDLAGLRFLYRARSFKYTSIDDQAIAIRSEMWPREHVVSWQMSHERTGEMLTLRQKYNLPFNKFSYYKPEDGVAQWRHMSRPDKSKPHPFLDDEQLEDGTWKLGRPNLYYVVDDEQLTVPRDDAGMKLLDDQVSTWDYVTVKVTETGQTAQKPSKINEDFCDATKSTLALFGPQAEPLTMLEEYERLIPPDAVIQWDVVTAQNRPPTLEEQTRQDLAVWQAQQKIIERYGLAEVD